ncbi:winged helix-turn-helix domain-containing protein [Labedaea rhizosphaerae]|uniref:Winged helix-turn-helix domain-containing protein n=1 Tax=Labedaea rhizosphaerae TaxID=598644 RepID=A0A4R6SBF6_LABRH|nr:crosslink repair DNA glycosylase YcaQ family protein [Labedaea rhizosphaerae]TDP97272.1 hypothetical protein EV186_103235 [Labedaea rhizosphaerae]
MTESRSLTPATARRIALAAQGFADKRPSGPPTRRHLRKTLDRVQVLQLDSVNVAVRAHYMPVFSRLGAYDRALVDDAAWSHSTRRPRLLVEYWAHMAALLPVEDWPLMRWRMQDYERSGGHWAAIADANPALVEDILSVVKEYGPIGAGKLEDVLGGSGGGRGKPKGGWWNRSQVKVVCEWLFLIGVLTTGARVNFERRYDLPERVVPPEIYAAPAPDAETAVRELVRRSALAHGIGTEPDLRDYYRLKPERSKPALAELVDAGELEPVHVRGWRLPAYVHPEARVPRAVRGRALLCPFDPLVWFRERTERLFGFHYRIEIYVPEPKRVHGYYVFPFLLDGELVARVDVKADRAAGVLRVPGAFAEPGTDHARVALELSEELKLMADWLELDGVAVGDKGDLSSALSALCG